LDRGVETLQLTLAITIEWVRLVPTPHHQRLKMRTVSCAQSEAVARIPTRMQLTLNYPIKIRVSQRKDFSMIFVGIDISKLSVDVAVLINGKYQSRQFENKQSGFLKLSQWIKSFKNPAYFCLEATRIYGLAIS
jgi:hypothetical protein